MALDAIRPCANSVGTSAPRSELGVRTIGKLPQRSPCTPGRVSGPLGDFTAFPLATLVPTARWRAGAPPPWSELQVLEKL